MPDSAFAQVAPNSLDHLDCSPVPAPGDRIFRGLLLAGPEQAVLTEPGVAGPLARSPLRFVVCASMTISLLDRRRFAADGMADALGAVTLVVADPAAGFVAAGRLILQPIRPARGLMPEVGDDEAARTVTRSYFNPNVPDVVPLPRRAGTYHLFLLLGSWVSNLITVRLRLPE